MGPAERDVGTRPGLTTSGREDKQAMATAPGDLASATITYWRLGVEPAQVHAFSRNIPHRV